MWLDFKKDALIDRWRLYKIAHKQEDDMGYPKRVGGVHFIEVFGRSEPVLPALLLRPSGDVEQLHQVLPLEEKMQTTDRGMPSNAVQRDPENQTSSPEGPSPEKPLFDLPVRCCERLVKLAINALTCSPGILTTVGPSLAWPSISILPSSRA